MVDEIQSVTVRARAVIAMDAAVRNDNDEGGEVALHSGCQDWTGPSIRRIVRIFGMQGSSMQYFPIGSIRHCSVEGVPGMTRIWVPGSNSEMRPGLGVPCIFV